jgi:hypothetical protein
MTGSLATVEALETSEGQVRCARSSPWCGAHCSERIVEQSSTILRHLLSKEQQRLLARGPVCRRRCRRQKPCPKMPCCW